MVVGEASLQVRMQLKLGNMTSPLEVFYTVQAMPAGAFVFRNCASDLRSKRQLELKTMITI